MNAPTPAASCRWLLFESLLLQSFLSAPRLPSTVWLWRLATLCWAAAMAWGCLQEASGAAPGWWRLPHVDKLAHAGMHGLLAWLLWHGTSRNAAWTGMRIALLCAAYGLGIEAGQALFTLTRSAEALDALANTAGAVTGVALAARLSVRAASRAAPAAA